MEAAFDDLILLTGTAHPALAASVAKRMRMHLGRADVGRFSDGEICIELLENVRGKEVVIIQPTCAPAGDNLMEIALMTDAARRSSASDITAIIPYLGYSRQDRRPRSARSPISARVVADILSGSGVSRILTIDLHAEQIQGFYRVPVDNVYAGPVLQGDWSRRGFDGALVVVSPDVGGVVRARALAKTVGAELAIIDKRRPAANVAKVMNIIGEVDNRTCIIVDDMVDTANTLCEAASALKDAGAPAVFAYCTHAVLSGGAVARVADSALDELVVTDTIPLCRDAEECAKIRALTVADLLAEAVARVVRRESVSSLFLE
jgi:ribose-phosphate pyrophosphokinase